MKFKIKTLITPFLLVVLMTLSSCMYKDVPYFVKEDVNNRKIFKFKDKNSSTVITMRTTDAIYNWASNETDVYLSYIIDIPSSLSKNSAQVYLRLVDGQDFRIEEIFISNIGEKYTGQLKGQFRMSYTGYINLASAEICLYTLL